MAKALSAYRTELTKKLGLKCRSSRTICRDFEQMNLETTRNYIKLSHATLVRLAAGGRTKAKANALKGWLTEAETEHVLTYAKEVGN